MPLKFMPLPTDQARAYQSGALDANGQAPERHLSTSHDTPCRHCLRNISPGQEMLILAHRPFNGLNPYTELGPIFLCAQACQAYQPGSELPPLFSKRGPLQNDAHTWV